MGEVPLYSLSGLVNNVQDLSWTQQNHSFYKAKVRELFGPPKKKNGTAFSRYFLGTLAPSLTLAGCRGAV